MRAVVQRVKESHVAIEDEIVARIGHGLLVLLGVETGRFRAMMAVSLINDGPVTIILES